MKRGGFVFWGLLFFSLSFFSMQGCATIVSGKTQQVTFTSVPDGATVSVQGRALGKTPLTVQLDKKSDQTLVFEKEGYKTLTLPLTTELDPWFWGNIILGGFFGSTTDAITGSVNKYSPGQYNVTLEPLKGVTPVDSSKNDAKTFIIANYKNILPELDTGQGQYVSSLMTLLKVEKPNQEQAIKMIKELAAQYKDIPTFADKVVNIFLK